MDIGEKICVISANCQGLRSMLKTTDVLNYMKERGANILCLQDTHWLNTDEPRIRKIWGNECIVNGQRTNSRGVAILFADNFEYKIINIEKDDIGNMLVVDLQLADITVKLINIYGPNYDCPQFYENIETILETNPQAYTLICGDLNISLNQDMDTLNYIGTNNPQAKSKVLKIMNDNNLIDVYRHLNPNVRKYTWHRKNPHKQARLDYFLTNLEFSDIISNCQIKPGYKSDHSFLKLDFLINKFAKGKGIWKLNVSLLKDQSYLNLINKIIIEEKHTYACPIYSNAFLNDHLNEIQLTIDEDLFLEMLLLRIRGETLKYSTELKRKKLSREKELISDIQNLENSNNFLSVSDLLQEKKNELEQLRMEKVQGTIIRSRVDWVSSGEKPSGFFCSLENKNYVEKTVKKIKKPDGSIITDQKSILN